jgi:hypothetical protein
MRRRDRTKVKLQETAEYPQSSRPRKRIYSAIIATVKYEDSKYLVC